MPSRYDELLRLLQAESAEPVFVPGLGLVDPRTADVARQSRAPRPALPGPIDPDQYQQWLTSISRRTPRPTGLQHFTQTAPETMARATQFATDITDPNYEGVLSGLPASLRGFLGGATEGLVGTFSNPAGVAGLAADVLMPGTGALRSLGHGAQAAASAPIAATGIERLLDSEASTRERVGGGAMGALGTLGALLGVSGLRQGAQAQRAGQRTEDIQAALRRWLGDPIEEAAERAAARGPGQAEKYRGPDDAFRPRSGEPPPEGALEISGFEQRPPQRRYRGPDSFRPASGEPPPEGALSTGLREPYPPALENPLLRRILGGVYEQGIVRNDPAMTGPPTMSLDIDALARPQRLPGLDALDLPQATPAVPATVSATAGSTSAEKYLSELLSGRRVSGQPLTPDELIAAKRYAKGTGQDYRDLADEFVTRAPDDPRGYVQLTDRQRASMEDLDQGYQRLIDDESGAVDPMLLLQHVLSGGAGAAAGYASSDSPLAPLVGAAAGATLPALIRNPQLFERVGYGGLLGAPSTIGGGHIGALSALTGKSLETALTGLLRGDTAELGRAGRMLGGIASPEARQAYTRAIREGVDEGADPTRWGPTDPRSPWTIPSRLMAGPDEAVRAAMQRAGETPDAARVAAFTSEPQTQTGRAIVDLQRALGPFARTLVFPFAKTVTNVAERGIERTPILGMLADAAAQKRTATAAKQAVPDLGTRIGRAATNPEVLARQLLGAGAGAAAYELLPEDGPTPYLAPFVAGPYAVPVGIMAALKQWQAAGADPADLPQVLVQAVGEESPLPTQAWQIEQATDPRKWATRLAPRGIMSLPGATPSAEFEQDTLLGPLFARLPYLNEELLKRRGGSRGSRSGGREPRRRRRSSRSGG